MDRSVDHLVTADGRLRVWTTFKKVTPDELFCYWTEPSKLSAWWPDEAVLEPVPGGHYRFSFLQTGRTLTGTFLEVIPGQRLAFSRNWRNPGSPAQAPSQEVVTDFEHRDSDTLLTITQGPYGESSAAKALRQSQQDDWAHFLGRLKAVYNQT